MYEHFFVPAIFRPLSGILLEAAGVRPGDHVLDLACGTGILARQLAPLVGSSGRVVAVDLRPGMLATARSIPLPTGTSVDFREGDALALDLSDETQDAVLCQQGLQFFANRVQALREAKRVSKRGGRLVFACWQGLERHPFYQELFDAEAQSMAAHGLAPEDATAPFSLSNADELRSLFVEAGLSQIELKEVTIHADFPAEDFIYNMEFAYAAVMPQFAESPRLFDALVEKLTRDTEALRARFTHGDRISYPLHTHLVTARA
jgi:ubiquinone/menaquinone biosynthesis C-methylase UbiE